MGLGEDGFVEAPLYEAEYTGTSVAYGHFNPGTIEDLVVRVVFLCVETTPVALQDRRRALPVRVVVIDARSQDTLDLLTLEVVQRLRAGDDHGNVKLETFRAEQAAEKMVAATLFAKDKGLRVVNFIVLLLVSIDSCGVYAIRPIGLLIPER